MLHAREVAIGQSNVDIVLLGMVSMVVAMQLVLIVARNKIPYQQEAQLKLKKDKTRECLKKENGLFHSSVQYYCLLVVIESR